MTVSSQKIPAVYLVLCFWRPPRIEFTISEFSSMKSMTDYVIIPDLPCQMLPDL